MKYFITGGTGFVGKHLIRSLIKQDHELFVLVRNPQKKFISHPKIHYIFGDLNPDTTFEWIEKIPTDIDGIIYLAGIVHSFEAKIFYHINTDGMWKFLVKATPYFKKDIKFLFLSTLAAAGPCPPGSDAIDESTPLNPKGNYGQSKFEAENTLQELVPPNWNVIIIRPPLVIGPEDPAFLDVFKMVKGSFVLYPGLDGAKKRYSYIGVYDLIQSIEKALSETLPHDKNIHDYFTANPNPITYEELISGVQKAMGKKFLIRLPFPTVIISFVAYFFWVMNKLFQWDFRLTPEKLAEIKEKNWVCHSEKSIQELSIKYEWDLEKILQTTWQEDYKNKI